MIPGVNGFGGAVVGATTGQAVRQGVKALRGEDASFGAIPKEAITTATIEGLTRGAGRLIPKAANRLMNSVIKPGRDILKRKPKFGLDALEAGITGSKSGMIDKAGSVIDSGEIALKGALAGKNGMVDAVKIADSMEDLKRPFMNVGDQASVDAITEVQKHLASKGQIGLEEANQLKRDFYKVIKDSAYGKGLGEVASKTSARKQAAGGLKRGIEAVVPETKAINKKIGTAVTAKDALENVIASGQRNVILPKLAGMGAGGLAVTGNLPAAAGVLIGDRAVDLMRSAPIVTGTAANLMRLRKFGQPIAKGASEIARRFGA